MQPSTRLSGRSVCTFREQIGYSNGKCMNILKYFWLRDSEEHFIPFYFTLMSWKCSKNWNYKSVQEILALLVGNTLDRESSWAGQDWRLETEHLCVSRPHWQWPALGGWMWWWWRVHWRHLSTASWGSICGIPPPPYNNSTLQHCTPEPEHPTHIYFKF